MKIKILKQEKKGTEFFNPQTGSDKETWDDIDSEEDKEWARRINEGSLKIKYKGGEGSGNFSHSGRPGEVGGSGNSKITSNMVVDDLGKGQSSATIDVNKSRKLANKYQCIDSVCYRNAQNVAVGEDGYTYNEGIFVTIGRGEPRYIDHAWLTDKDGDIVDPTFHEKGIYYPIIKANKQQIQELEKEKDMYTGDRLLSYIRKHGITVQYGKLQNILFDKTKKQLLKDYGNSSDGIQYEGSLDFRR